MEKAQIQFERISPEKAGIASDAVLAFVEKVEELGIPLHSFMLLRSGRLVAEGYYSPFQADHLHPIFSVSKSVTSAAIGIAIGEGLLKLTDRVVDFFPEKLEDEVHPYTAMMTIEHLLLMATVHPRSTHKQQADDWVKVFLNTPPSKMPGTSFAYDTTGTHTLAAIVHKVTGTSVLAYLRPRLFDPLGMGELWWENCPSGINKGGSGLHCTTDALARFGQLYLQDGVWNNVRILPEGWVERSTGNRIGTYGTRFMLDGKLGYGYKFWRIRNNGYCAFGMGGQLVIVLPDQEVVLVTTANTLEYKDGQALIFECFWSTIYASLIENDGASLAPNVPAENALQQRLTTLKLFMPEGKVSSPLLGNISGRRWILEPNQYDYEACEFELEGEEPGLYFYKEGKRVDLRFGLGDWTPGVDPIMHTDSTSYGAAVWTDERTLVVTVHIVHPLQMFTFTCRFQEQDSLSVQIVPAGIQLNEHDGHLSGHLR
ncbi:serine hydrolase [Paenibacillus qinlingensis]|uniref:CubicO group peptidase (Beta-lactamase class C family) n=1 Tax=Paenibacillus qinlingensis TaxID=1837343 RepID=A0ABU1NWS8_9BACL|nr:serine hydrolase [Paenibacillus qinlingensis]MDR6551937.1 CubicO group peptidase (beta-lactamase class C family) [Paenibacillus qinlingensis]